MLTSTGCRAAPPAGYIRSAASSTRPPSTGMVTSLTRALTYRPVMGRYKFAASVAIFGQCRFLAGAPFAGVLEACGEPGAFPEGVLDERPKHKLTMSPPDDLGVHG